MYFQQKIIYDISHCIENMETKVRYMYVLITFTKGTQAFKVSSQIMLFLIQKPFLHIFSSKIIAIQIGARETLIQAGVCSISCGFCRFSDLGGVITLFAFISV